MPWRSRWSGARLSSTAASGANATVSSSWNDDASQTTTAAGSSVPGERRERGADVAGHGDRQPGLAMDLADQLGRRRLAVGPGDRDHVVRQQPPAELELARPRARRARARRATTGAVLRHARALDDRRDAVEQRPRRRRARAPRRRPPPARRARRRRRRPRRSRPPPRRAPRSARPAARPERARPTTRNGPGGSGGRRPWHAIQAARTAAASADPHTARSSAPMSGCWLERCPARAEVSSDRAAASRAAPPGRSRGQPPLGGSSRPAPPHGPRAASRGRSRPPAGRAAAIAELREVGVRA